MPVTLRRHLKTIKVDGKRVVPFGAKKEGFKIGNDLRKTMGPFTGRSIKSTSSEVERAILAHPEEIVIPALIESLHNPNRSVREWSAEIAAHYSRPELICPLTNLLRKGGVDERIAAVIALEVIGTTEVKKELEGVL